MYIIISRYEWKLAKTANANRSLKESSLDILISDWTIDSRFLAQANDKVYAINDQFWIRKCENSGVKILNS